MSCGAECLFEMMGFNYMDGLRGNPGSSNYKVDKDEIGKYSVGLNKKNYDIASDKSYFGMPTKSNVYAAALFYRQSAYNVIPKKAAEVNQSNQNPSIKQDISSEIDSLEALIGSAKAKESLRWIQ